jgi:paraquat-inducible protein B
MPQTHVEQQCYYIQRDDGSVTCYLRGNNGLHHVLCDTLDDASPLQVEVLRNAYNTTTARLHETQQELQQVQAQLASALRDLDAAQRKAAELRSELAEEQRLMSYIDTIMPPADDTCDEPGISFTEACRRQRRDDNAYRQLLKASGDA